MNQELDQALSEIRNQVKEHLTELCRERVYLYDEGINMENSRTNRLVVIATPRFGEYNARHLIKVMVADEAIRRVADTLTY